MKHSIQLEIEIPDDYPDGCWKHGEQVLDDLLITPAMLHLINMKIKAEIYQKEPEVSAESKAEFLKWLDVKKKIIEDIKITLL